MLRGRRLRPRVSGEGPGGVLAALGLESRDIIASPDLEFLQGIPTEEDRWSLLSLPHPG